MTELRCDCNQYKPLILKYSDTIVEGQCRKCKKKHKLEVIDGRLQEVRDGKEETQTET